MNTALRIIAGLLGAAFRAKSAMKLTQPKGKLAASGMGFVEGFSAIGTVEVLVAVGLILPAALGMAPVLVPLAAVSLGLLMVSAILTHLRRDEAKARVVPLTLLALAAPVAWGRSGPQPFTG